MGRDGVGVGCSMAVGEAGGMEALLEALWMGTNVLPGDSGPAFLLLAASTSFSRFRSKPFHESMFFCVQW